MSHRCHAHGCSRTVPPKFLFCAPHWHQTRKTLQNAIWNEYRPGQEEAGSSEARKLGSSEVSRQQTADSPGTDQNQMPPKAQSPKPHLGPSDRYMAIQRLCVSELCHRLPSGRAIALRYAEQAEAYRQKAIASGAGDPFEQLERRKKKTDGQLSLSFEASSDANGRAS